MKFIKPDELQLRLKSFSKNIAVTEGHFEVAVPGYLEDMEWNHMDQMHRPYIHHTYEEAIRIALGDNFAVSLTKWKKIPIFITVTDVRLKQGLYYQVMAIAGLLYIHLVIEMTEHNQIVTSRLTWYITSHKWLKLFHKPLSKKLFNLNIRLQEEDAPIREQRFHLRKKGYQFASDPVNYYSSNTMGRNTLYPSMQTASHFDVKNLPFNELVECEIGGVEFIIKRLSIDEMLIWPSACPHEGGALMTGKICQNHQIQCPWHGLKFTGIKLVAGEKSVGHNFEFTLTDTILTVQSVAQKTTPCLRESELTI